MTAPKQVKKSIPADGIVITNAHENINDQSPVEPILLNEEQQVMSSEPKSQKIEKPDFDETSNRQLDYVSDREKERRRLAYETELTTGIFRNFEKPGQVHEFTMRLERGPVQRFKLFDGKVHQLPRNVARYINQNCWYPEHEYAMDEFGEQKYNIGKKVYRFAFDNGEYYEEPTPGLIQTTNTQKQEFLANKNKVVPARR
jgi:hypothetical protein